MSLALRTNGTNSSNRQLSRDPFAFARDLFAWDPFFAGRQVTAFSPSFEVKETQDSFVVKADLPGVLDSNLDIAVHNSVLTVSGSRAADERKEGENYALYERQFGSFSRSFALPDTADGEKIEAKLDAGVLTLTIGKKVEAKPRKISISTTK